MSSPSPKPSRWSRHPPEGSTTPPDGANGATAAPAGKDTSDTASIKSNKSTRSFASLASSLTRSNSKKKLKQSALDTTPQGLLSVNPATSALMVPSPIAESPNREASETEPAPPGPSKLESSEGSEMEPVDVESPSSLTGYVPPPLLDSSAGNPGAFTDDPDSLPQPTIVQDPYASHSQVNLAAANPATPPPETPERSTRGLEEEGESNRGTFFGEPVVESIASQSRSLSRDRRAPSETDRDVFSAAVEEHAAIVSPPEEPKDREMAGYGFGTGQAPAS
ncbi:hypothetical protein DFP72DRAFT_1071838 [Ephemerocybe angulata]|uniref:Uncharacterized protein n=1 Tax=Ephemerocybe angulata TaxID=980116 RepID=A0A8H6M1J1_9AGAR|nr:hypothetical protein DFP72DRAFT_1071838 [Tulosesus angulatus]